MTGKRRPDSRINKALRLMAESPVLTSDDYLRLLGQVCSTKDEIHNLSSNLKAAGYVERHVRLTAAGLAALGMP